MSTLTSGATSKVTGLFQAAYCWLRGEPQPGRLKAPPPTAAAPQPPPKPPPPGTQPPPQQPTPQTASNGDTLHLPLQPILNTLPAELKARLRRQATGAFTVSIPLSRVMAQLPKGVVHISFGELRLAAPGVFLLATDCDHVPVWLPLNEILTHVSPAKLARRCDQKVVEVPEEVISPFGKNGKGLTLSATPERAAIALLARATTPAQPNRPTPPVGFQRSVAPSPASAPAVPPHSVTPAALPKPSPVALPPKPASSVFAAPPPPAIPFSAPTPVGRPKPAGGNGEATQFPEPRPPQSAAPSAATAASVATSGHPATDYLQVPLLSLMNAWPQAVRLEIAQMNLIDAKVVVPVTVLEKGLHQGRVEFPWRSVRAWIRPEVRALVSANDGAALELPLSVIAPVFIAHRKPAASAQRRVVVDATIQDLFFGFPKGDSAHGRVNAAAVPAPAPVEATDTDFCVWRGDDDERPKVEPAEPASRPATSTNFPRPQATPHEIVTRATSLDGVAGALVALPDGLAVASRVPAGFNRDALAAFLPQIFAKVSQCTKELRTGDLNNLSFTVGNVPWKIFRVNNVFFAAFGRAEEPLPCAQLAALAAELDRNAKAA